MNFGSTFVALETSGRLFGLDYQLLFDAAITAINVFILFLLVSVILFNPVRNMLKKRQEKTAMHNEQKIIDEAKEEAARIIERAGKEAELEKQKVADEVKQQIVTVSAMIASKLISKSIDESESNAIIEQTLNEMGENTWRN